MGKVPPIYFFRPFSLSGVAVGSEFVAATDLEQAVSDALVDGDFSFDPEHLSRLLTREMFTGTGEFAGYIVEGDEPSADDQDACPGCGCLPGDGVTPGCQDPDGCGFSAESDSSAAVPGPVAVAFWLAWNCGYHGIVLTEERPVWHNEFSVTTDEGFRSGSLTLTLHGRDAVDEPYVHYEAEYSSRDCDGNHGHEEEAICPISDLAAGSPLVLHVNPDGSLVEHPTFCLPLWQWL